MIRKFFLFFVIFISILYFVKGKQNTLQKIDKSLITIPIQTETTITLTFANKFNEYPSKIGLVETASQKVIVQYNTLKQETENIVKFSIPTTMTAVGAYNIQVVLAKERYICDSTNILYLYKDAGKITIPGIKSITVINPTVIDFIKITFNQEIFIGRLEVKEKAKDHVIKYYIDPNDSKSIKLIVKNKKYDAQTEYTIKDKVKTPLYISYCINKT